LKRDVDYIAAINATWMICASPNWPIGMEHNSPMDRSEIQREADMLNQLGVYAKERHVTILHNPHSYTPVCRRQDIDYLMKITDPSLVKLCVDSGHSVVAGVDAIALLRDYAERVEYIHLKDLNTTKKDRGRGKNWVPLGMGTVNLPLFMKTLGDINYQGVVCVGLPTGCERINRFESARISRNYLWQTFGL
jgi:inosose dehydratase